MNGFYRQLTEILKRHGFYFLRPGKGDHEIWGNDKIQRPVDRNSRSRHTANQILKQFGIKEKNLEEVKYDNRLDSLFCRLPCIDCGDSYPSALG